MNEERDPLRVLVAEHSYSVKELAYLWNLSEETIRRLFEEEPGVLAFTDVQRRRKVNSRRKPYTTLRIPGHVAFRVRNRVAVVDP
jgi:AraC-like DNA-binding protein